MRDNSNSHNTATMHSATTTQTMHPHHASSRRPHHLAPNGSPSNSFHTKTPSHHTKPVLPPWLHMPEAIVMLEPGGRIALIVSPNTSAFNPSLIGTSMYDIINESERHALRDAMDEATRTKLPTDRTAISSCDAPAGEVSQWIAYKVHPIVQHIGHGNVKVDHEAVVTKYMVTRIDITESRVMDAIKRHAAWYRMRCMDIGSNDAQLAELRLIKRTFLTLLQQLGAAPSFSNNFIEALPTEGFPADTMTLIQQSTATTDLRTDAFLSTHPRTLEYFLSLGFRSSASHPINSTKTHTALGALVTYFRHDRGPSELDMRLLSESASLAGFAVTLRQAEDYLRRVSEARFYGIDVANDHDLTFVVDLRGRASFVNSVARQLLGISEAEDVRGVDVIEAFVADKDRHAIRACVEQAWETTGVASAMQCVRFRPRRWAVSEEGTVYVELKVKGLWNVPGVNGCLIHGRDVTSRIVAHKEMLTSQESLSVTLNSLNEGVIRTDENGKIEQINFAFLKLLDPQLAADASSPRRPTDLTTPDGVVDDTHEQAFDLAGWLVGKPVSILLKVMQVFVADDNALQHLTGVEPVGTPRVDRDFNTSGWTTLPNADDDSKQIACSPPNSGFASPPNSNGQSPDPATSESRYRAVYANINDMIERAIRTQEEVTLRDTAQLPWQQHVDDPELLRDDVEWILDSHMEDPERGRNVGYLVRSDVSPKLLAVEVSVSPLRQFTDAFGGGGSPGSDNAKGTVIVVRDSSEMTKARLANKRLANKSRWISVITHEMRTPVHGIIGMLDLLRKTNLSQEQKGLVNCMEVSANALICLVSNVLDQSRLEAGKVTLEMVPFNMKERLKSFVDLMTMMAKTKRVNFSADIDSEIPEVLFSDFNRLFQILLNLISNAMKFCSRGHKSRMQGEVKLRVRIVHDFSNPLAKPTSSTLRPKVTPLQESNSNAKEGVILMSIKPFNRLFDEADIVNLFSAADLGSCMPSPSTSRVQLLFEIEDNGIGISKQNQSKLFKEFGQAEDSTTRRYGGSGMGLYICKQLVELFSGTIGCESELGKGSRFQFTAWFQRGESVNTPSSDTKEFFVEERAMMVSKAYGDSPDSGLDVEEGQSTGSSSGTESGTEDGKLGKADEGEGEVAEARGTGKERLTKDKIKILVADDDMINQQVLAKFLEGLGYKNVDVVSNGKAAVEKCKKKSYNFVLMDLFMPVMDGLEAAATIKANCEPRTFPTIIVITGDDNVNPKHYADAGVRNHLTKPVRMQVLKAELEKYVELVE
ncbi:hypothetical protein BC938DRAFT_482573 [Jimgerdemannia flammicorona]|uniref:histidine kinase n=1 Tax=Jimgerdemannia flammicorona TaxID=994334 RepID=A0A433QDP4_9FUNG|nr:hypothetical protein BC938DRAFT_482573 [Jimgerdemannia flammicorona]